MGFGTLIVGFFVVMCRMKVPNAFATPKKGFDDVAPAFAKKCDEDVEDQVESLPSFIMASNTCDECLKMSKERDEAKPTEKLRKEARTEAMNRFETE